MSTEPITLVCLPFAGAGASFFRPWSRHAVEGIEILAPQLPGRERRIAEEPHRDVHAAVAGLVADLRARLAGTAKVALFGHSLGAVLAYELAHRLVAESELEPVWLFVSGSPEPRVPREGRATGLPDEEFLPRVAEFAGYQHEALDDPEMRELILPALRADVEMHENYTPSVTTPLAVPVTSIRGGSDELVSAAEAAGWAAVTNKDFELVELSGGHMYLTESAGPLLRLVGDRVR